MTTAKQLAAEINKLLGKETVLLGSDERFKVTYTPTGLLPFDVLLGGGLPRGRFVVLTGGYSTLKTYVGLNAIREVQRAGGVAALIDTEHAYDPEWAESLGVKTDDLILWPDLDDNGNHSGEEAIDVAEVLTRSKVDLIVFDSVAAALPQQEQNKRLHGENIQPGRQAALMSAACRKLTAANSRTAILWINQLREQIGITFGPTEKAPGGRALPYYASMIVNIKHAGKLTRDIKTFTGDKYASVKEQIGQTYRAIIEKSKLNRPFREVFFDFDLESDPPGINLVKFLFAQGVELGLITKKGNTWSYGDLKAVGKEKFMVKLADAAEELEQAIREHHGLSPLPGKSARASKKAAASRSKSSSGTARGRTLAAGRAASRSTGRPLKRLSK